MSGPDRNHGALKVRTDEIKDSGYHMSCTRDAQWLRELCSDIDDSDFTFVDDITIQLDIAKAEENIFINCVIAVPIGLHCIRCLADFKFPLEATFHYTLYPDRDRYSSPDQEINREDLDVLYYQGDIIEISPVVREQLLLGIPSHPLCHTSCKGICPQCGANLNNTSCQCDTKKGSASKFEALKDFTVKH